MAPAADADTPHIGTLNESTLHEQLKELVAEPGDRFEVPLEGFVIDVMRGSALIEIQTGSFGAMGRKLDRLLSEYRIHLVHPIAATTMLLRGDARPRRSPKKGSIYDLFTELVSIPTLIDHPNMTLEVVVASIDKIQVEDPKARRGRGGYRTIDRRLGEIQQRHRFESPIDLLRLVPDGLPEIFTTADLSGAANMSRDNAQRMAYCMRAMGLFTELDRTRAGKQYRLGPGTSKR